MSNINTVMIVDDSKIDQITAKYAIEDYDASIKVLSAYDGQEALDMLEKLGQPVDIILLDINMPGMDGHEFLAEYSKQDLPISVVVMLTSSDQELDIEKSKAYPFVKEYLSKPLEVADIRALEMCLR